MTRGDIRLSLAFSIYGNSPSNVARDEERQYWIQNPEKPGVAMRRDSSMVQASKTRTKPGISALGKG
jgi:hypothetical protein